MRRQHEVSIRIQGDPPARLVRLVSRVAGARPWGNCPIRRGHILTFIYDEEEKAKKAARRLARMSEVWDVEYAGPVVVSEE